MTHSSDDLARIITHRTLDCLSSPEGSGGIECSQPSTMELLATRLWDSQRACQGIFGREFRWKVDSPVKRFERWLRNESVETESIYIRFAKALLLSWCPYRRGEEPISNRIAALIAIGHRDTFGEALLLAVKKFALRIDAFPDER